MVEPSLNRTLSRDLARDLARKVARNLASVRDRIAEAADRAGRDPDEVRLVAVTKGHPLEVVEAALEAGIEDLAENRVEALETRLQEVSPGRCRWHMVGRLQRRKAPWIRGRVELLHSLDSVRLAERLQRTWGEGEPVLPVLVQVNTSGEETKGGFSPEGIGDALEAILGMGSLRPLGLMTMAPFTDEEEEIRRSFRALRELRDRLRDRFPGWAGTELSMGMSNDFTLAVEEGSTMVRLGTALFGERDG